MRLDPVATEPPRKGGSPWLLVSLSIVGLAWTCRGAFASHGTDRMTFEVAASALERGGMREEDRIMAQRVVREAASRAVAIFKAGKDEHSIANLEHVRAEAR